MSKPAAGAYGKFWAALAIAVNAAITAASDWHLTPDEISAVGHLFTAAALVYLIRNSTGPVADRRATMPPGQVPS